jgi:hypothetical protein
LPAESTPHERLPDGDALHTVVRDGLGRARQQAALDSQAALTSRQREVPLLHDPLGDDLHEPGTQRDDATEGDDDLVVPDREHDEHGRSDRCEHEVEREHGADHDPQRRYDGDDAAVLGVVQLLLTVRPRQQHAPQRTGVVEGEEA